MPLRRVRPVRRALVGGAVATAAYQGGKRRASTDARLDQLEEQPADYAAPPPPAYAAPPPVAPAPPPVSAPPAPPPDRLDELKKLAELKEMGALSDEEFAVEKARILRS
ncbi:MAG: SHOCT domain-containing protein [Acidimicrobiia bacterium]|nr:SHOCT domain-containing protein [Acidimicrobiia bacterium]